MSDRFPVSVEIGGKLELSKLHKLIDTINSADMALECGETSLKIKTKANLIETICPKRKTINLVDLERAWGETDNVQENLKKFGLTYKIIVSPLYEYGGELRYWSPETDLVELECDSSGHVITTQEELKEILHLLYGATMLSISKQQFDKVDKAIKKLEKLTQEFTVPAFEIVEK
jgi:hypothetical protein